MASTLSTMPPIISENPAARAMLHMESASVTPDFISLMLTAWAPWSRARRSTSAEERADSLPVLPRDGLFEELERHLTGDERCQKRAGLVHGIASVGVRQETSVGRHAVDGREPSGVLFRPHGPNLDLEGPDPPREDGVRGADRM